MQPRLRMMGFFTRIGIALGSLGCAAVMTAGCNPGPDPVGQSDFQLKMVHALCDSIQNCCTTAERGFDPVHCAQAVTQTFIVPLRDTSLLYDSSEAGACIEAVGN